MSEQEQLYRAICQNPEDTTTRLVYADWLDENGDADLAEFIRVQCATSADIDSARFNHFDIRSDALLERHGDQWRRAECPECRGRGKTESITMPSHLPVYRTADEAMAAGTAIIRERLCPTCGGTGDLFRFRRVIDNAGTSHGVDSREITFRNGFPDSVTCRLEEVGEETERYCEACSGLGAHPPALECYCYKGTAFVRRFALTPWALAVVGTTPVTRFRTELEPTREEGGWEWYGLPDWLNVPETKQTFVTADAARDALAMAIGRVVRRSAYSSQEEGRGGSK